MRLYLAIDPIGTPVEQGEETIDEISLAREFTMVDVGFGVPDPPAS